MNKDTPAEMYLDLLMRSLTNTIFEDEPNIDDDQFLFTMNCASHCVKSKKSYGEWGSIFGDPIIATAILDACCITPRRSAFEGKAIASKSAVKLDCFLRRKHSTRNQLLPLRSIAAT